VLSNEGDEVVGVCLGNDDALYSLVGKWKLFIGHSGF